MAALGTGLGAMGDLGTGLGAGGESGDEVGDFRGVGDGIGVSWGVGDMVGGFQGIGDRVGDGWEVENEHGRVGNGYGGVGNGHGGWGNAHGEGTSEPASTWQHNQRGKRAGARVRRKPRRGPPMIPESGELSNDSNSKYYHDLESDDGDSENPLNMKHLYHSSTWGKAHIENQKNFVVHHTQGRISLSFPHF
jgi:hypothetical protein